MVEIIICDDDKFIVEYSKKLASEAIEKFKLDAEIVCITTEFQEIIRFLSKNPGEYLYFLDLDFGKNSLNGLDMAKLIKEKEPFSKIVFVTSHGDMGINILKSGVEAFGFIEKTLDTNKMLMDYKKYIYLALEKKEKVMTLETENKEELFDQPDKSIILPIGIDEHIEIPFSQILYIETIKNKSHFICYHTVDGSSISIRDTIENALNGLDKRFMKSHRSIIINKNYVVALKDGFVKFAGGQEVPFSFRMKQEIIKNCLG